MAENVIPALSVRPKWAALILQRRKTIETRRFQTRHRGDLLIVATLKGCGIGLPIIGGAAVCLVELVNVRPMMEADAAAACVEFAPGLFAWELGNVRPVEPRRVRGRQRMFHVKRTLVVAIDSYVWPLRSDS